MITKVGNTTTCAEWFAIRKRALSAGGRGFLPTPAASLAVTVAMIAVGIPVSAQEVTRTATSNTQTADEDATIDTIVVTGSLIPRPNVEYASPVTVLDENFFEHIGDTNIIRELHKVPQIMPTRGPTQGGGFSGSFIDLRGMGWVRTLILVNGRRYVSTLSGGGVDVSTIPPELIDRTELLTGGASATYGSDAIAGVANFILRRDIDGVEFNAQNGVTDRGEQSTMHFGIVGGSKFADDRGYGYLSLSYDESELILPEDRAFANQVFNNVNGALVPVTSSFTGTGVANAPPFGGPAIFNSSGELFSSPGVINPLTAGARFNTGVGANLQQPQELRTMHGGLDFALNDSIEFYTEASFIDSETVRSLVSNAVNITLPVNINNPYLGPLTQQWLASRDTNGDGREIIPGLRRRFNEVGPGGAVTPRTSYRVLGGTRISLAKGWSLDAYYLDQRSRFNWEANGSVGFDQLEQALLATTDANGNIVCIDARFECVPVDVFRPNALTAAQANFLHVTPKVKSTNQDRIASVTAAGNLWDLPAGPLGAALGAEYLSFSASEVPDTILTTRRSSAEAFVPVAGANRSTELFGEAKIPLLAKRPGVHYLGVEAGVRYSDFELSGGAWTYKGLLEWAPVDGFKVRGGLQHAIRQPAVFERFAGDAFFDLLETDPCITGAPLTGALRSACLASGMTAAVADTGVTPDPDGYIYLNRDLASPDLAPEEADSYTFGFVLDGLGLEKLTATVDYYDIKIDGGISTFGVDLIVRQCYDFASEANNVYCELISRNPVSGAVTELNNVRVNTAELRRTGIDFAAAYPFDLGESGGTLRVSVMANYRLEGSLLPTILAPEELLDCVGYYSPACGVQPKFQMLNTVNWNAGPVKTALTWQYLGSSEDIFVKENPAAAADLANPSISSESYLDLYAAWRIVDNVEVFGGVNNLLDNEPPIVGNDRGSFANSYPAQYDLIGRRYYLGTRISF